MNLFNNFTWKCPLTNRRTRDDFPTAASPKRTSLNCRILLLAGRGAAILTQQKQTHEHNNAHKAQTLDLKNTMKNYLK